MPDKRRHRGSHPQDDELFASSRLSTLRRAVGDFSWLLSNGYAHDSALKLVGDRHVLTARQRTAIMRSACSDQAMVSRRSRRIGLPVEDVQCLGVDGYNLLITIESALAGGLVLIGRDGSYRDLASVHGTYRRVEETIGALQLIFDCLEVSGASRIDWFLDRPVSNSGRLKALMAETLERRSTPHASTPTWNIELVDSPDQCLSDYADPVVSTDSVILDRCRSWINLAGEIIERRIPEAWRVDLRPDDEH